MNFGSEIEGLSPSFCQIFNEAAEAQTRGLGQICGCGYRKALEFLVKDFSIHRNAEKDNEIKAAPVGEVIKCYVENQRIKEVARRATWIGNDETHYVRRWGDRDIKDLTLLIELTVSWIRTELLTEKIIEEMPDPSAPGPGGADPPPPTT